MTRKSYCENLEASSRGPGSTKIEPTGKTRVGALRYPRLTRVTYSAAVSSSSICIDSYSMPRDSNHRFAMRQSPHHEVCMRVEHSRNDGEQAKLTRSTNRVFGEAKCSNPCSNAGDIRRKMTINGGQNKAF